MDAEGREKWDEMKGKELGCVVYMYQLHTRNVNVLQTYTKKTNQN